MASGRERLDASPAAKRGRSSSPPSDSSPGLFYTGSTPPPTKQVKREQYEPAARALLTPEASTTGGEQDYSNAAQAASELDQDVKPQNLSTFQAPVAQMTFEPPAPASTIGVSNMPTEVKHEVKLETKMPVEASKNRDRPALAAYAPGFREIAPGVANACRDVDEVTTRCKDRGFDDRYIQPHHEVLVKHCNPVAFFPQTESWAMLGTMGVGKSSFIGVVAGDTCIAPSGNVNRGTYTVFEYRGSKLGQETKYLVEAEYKSREAIEAWLTELIDDAAELGKQRARYEMFQQRRERQSMGEEDETDEELDDFDKSHLDYLEDQHRSATEALFSVLGSDVDNGENFQGPQDVDKWLQQQLSDLKAPDGKASVVETVRIRIDGIKAARNAVYGVETHHAKKPGDLRKIFNLVAKPSPAKVTAKVEQHPWPIIAKIIVYCNLPLLEAGIVIVDTPGLLDNNTGITSSTKVILPLVDHVLVAVPGRRCLQSSALNDQLRDIIHHDKMSNTSLLLTQIDAFANATDDNVDELAEDFQQPFTDCCEEYRATLDEQEEVKQEEAEEDDGKETERSLEVANRLSFLDRKRQRLAVVGSCKGLTPGLELKLKELSVSQSAPKLKVFTTSAEQYKAHITKGSKPPFLDLTETGIPAVIQDMYRGRAATMIQSLEATCITTLPDAIRNMKKMLTAPPKNQSVELRDRVLVALDEGLTEMLKHVKRRMLSAFTKTLKTILAKKAKQCPDKAKKLMKEWSKPSLYSGAVFTTFCKHHGDWHLGKDRTQVSWNLMIVLVLAQEKEVTAGFDKFEAEVRALKSDASRIVEDHAVSSFFKALGSYADEGDPMHEYAIHAKVVARDTFEEILSGWAEKLVKLAPLFRRRATGARGDTSYISNEMDATYEKAMKVSGQAKGSNGKRITLADRRKEIIRQKIEEEPDNVYVGLADRICKGWTQTVNKWETDSKSTFANVKKKFKSQFRTKEEQDDMTKQLQEDLAAEILDAVQHLEDHLQNVAMPKLEECKQWERDNSGEALGLIKEEVQ